LSDLRPIAFDSSHTECIPGTQRHELEYIIGWLLTPSPGFHGLWLYGVAGIGKSAISFTIAQYFLSFGRLGALLPFDWNRATNCDPAAIVRTISYQLAQFHPLIKAAIIQQLRSSPGVTQAPFLVQFEELLRKPLESIRILASEGPIVVAIDGLDDCVDAASQTSVLHMLSTELARLPPYFRFLLSSRNAPDINLPNFEARLVNMASPEDIMTFLQRALDTTTITLLSNQSSDGLLKNALSELIDEAGGSFLRASMMVKIFRSVNEPQSPTLFHTPSFRRRLCVEMSAIYAGVLERSIDWANKGDASMCRTVLGATAMLHAPVTRSILEQLLGYDDGVRQMLNRLGGAIHQELGGPIQLLAPFVEYLRSYDQCGDRPWFIDSPTLQDCHRRLACGCFRIMKQGLCFNICGAKTSFLSNADLKNTSQFSLDPISPELAYATQHWASHLQYSSYDHELVVDVDYFISSQFLYWLEVLSFLECVPIATPSLLRAVKWIRVSMWFITSTVH
jgi:hypothetical protein